MRSVTVLEVLANSLRFVIIVEYTQFEVCDYCSGILTSSLRFVTGGYTYSLSFVTVVDILANSLRFVIIEEYPQTV